MEMEREMCGQESRTVGEKQRMLLIEKGSDAVLFNESSEKTDRSVSVFLDIPAHDLVKVWPR